MKKQKKLLVLTSTLPRFEDDPEPGFVLHLSAALQAHFDVSILAPMGEGAEESAMLSGVPIKRYRYAPFRAWETLAYPGGIMPRLRKDCWRWVQVPMLLYGLLRAIRRAHQQEGYDLIHAHWLIPQGVAALAALPAGQRPPLVLTSHGGDLHTLAHSRVAFLLRWVLSRAQGLTTVSPALESLAKDLQASPIENAAVIPMGVDVEKFQDVTARVAKASSNDGLMRFLFVGRLAEKKGVRFLLDALTVAPLNGRQLEVQIAGDGPLLEGLKAQAERLNLLNKVRFLGAVPYREVAQLMAAADVVVVPSVEAADGDCDGLPTVMLEAMASRRLVIGTPVGGITQVLKDGVTGRLVPSQDSQALAQAMLDCIDQPDTREGMVSEAYRVVQDYDWKVIAARYAAVLNRALAVDEHTKDAG